MARNTEGVVVLFTAKAKAGKTEQVRAAFLALVTGSRHDEGCVSYELHEIEDDPSTLILYEQWISPELLEAHLASPPLEQLKFEIADLIEGSFEDGLKKLVKLRPAAN